MTVGVDQNQGINVDSILSQMKVVHPTLPFRGIPARSAIQLMQLLRNTDFLLQSMGTNRVNPT
jgi:hypothetical protein